ncbi:MAG TPA: hypothetical protein VLS90_03915, partial [Thermodesulfobacteriota bacterium]|nr:hypothetical protein [Thermodesulfobacteriota bacterium]
VRAPFLLLMSDHLFDPRIVVKLTARPLPRGCCRLAVDFRPEKVFDIDDATKVEVRDGKIAAIGKEIANYKGVDTGIFFCTASLFTALEEDRRNGRESLSDGIRELARRGRMEAADIGDLFWQDVDDPSALREAERKISKVPPSGYPEEPEGKAVRQVQANPGNGRKAP